MAAHAATRPLLALLALALASWAVFNGRLALSSTGSPTYPIPAELPVVGFVLGTAGALTIVSIAALIARAKWAEPLRYRRRTSISIHLAFPHGRSRKRLRVNESLTDSGIPPAIGCFAQELLSRPSAR